ncbi:MAG: flagellar biosynthesis anti-sigma factor FlgM [Pseudomonadota bacterium]
MPSFELGKLQGVSPARALSESDRTGLDINSKTSARAPDSASTKPGVSLEVSAALDPSKPPVDTDRVSQIREAIKDGTYPLVPTKIADAIIAARVGFGVESA